MKGFKTIIAVMAILGLWGTACGEEGKFAGEVSLTGIIRDGKDTDAKFNEYKDIQSGVYGSVDLRYEAPKDHISFEAKDIGYRTQSYALEGGRWDVFHMKFNYDEIPHNFTYDARSFYSGAGTKDLTYIGAKPSANTDGWNTFDYSVKRKNLGGSLKFDLLNPFYVDVSVDQQKKAGTYALAAAGTTPGGMAIELPTNIDYKSDNLKVEAGYATKPLFLSVSYLYSRFENGDGLQNFRNPASTNTAATTDTLYLPPENDYGKFNFRGGVTLPFQSKFSFDLYSARGGSSVLLANSYVSDTTAAASNIGVQGRTGIGLSSPYYNGKTSTDNYNVVFTTSPMSFFSTKIYYKYYNKDNTSDIITTTDGTNILNNKLFDYRKNIFGIEAGFTLPAHLRLTAAYSYTKTDRAREDIPKNRDNLFDVGLKWNGLNFMTAKIGYERLDRAAEFAVPMSPVVDLEPWVRRFDAAPQGRDTYKATLEFFPLASLSFNVGYKHKKNNYNDTILGLTDSNVDEVNADIDWQVHKRVRLFGYFDFEQRVLNQFQRQTTVANNPATQPTATAFNWTANTTENTYGYGVGADVSIITDKLNLKLTHNFVKSDGLVDYTYLLGAVALPAGQNQDNIDLNARDNYRLSNFVVKATYQMTKMVALTAAYAYEQFTYDDSQYYNYQYVPGTTGYMTGAYNNQPYRTNVVLLSVNVKF